MCVDFAVFIFNRYKFISLTYKNDKAFMLNAQTHSFVNWPTSFLS